MVGQKRLTQRQLAFLNDLFSSDLEEDEVLSKHGVRRSTYNRWLLDAVFLKRFRQHLNGARRRSELLMARYTSLAAAKLVELTTSGKGETARKACIDIMTLPNRFSEDVEQTQTSNKNAEKPAAEAAELSPERASRILAALAEEKMEKQGKKGGT
jgi:hypothetical protein